MLNENTLIVLLAVLFFGLVMPEIFKKVKLPIVSSIILIGSILGPYGIQYVGENEIVSFFGFLGMSFLMFMTGLETDISRVSKLWKKVMTLALFNGIIPFIVGYLITMFLGYGPLVSTLIGVIFISSSVTMVVQSLKTAEIFNEDVGQLVVSATIILDIASLVILSFILQGVAPITQLPLHIYYFVLIVSIALLVTIIPKVIRFLFKRNFFSKADYEEQLRFVILIMIAVLAYFSILGVHPILAGFTIGLALSQVVRDQVLFDKIHTLAYGLFVPVFFFVIGMELDLSLLTKITLENLVIPVLIFSLLFIKFFSGFLGGKVAKLSNTDSSIFGIASTAQLTTTLAVVYTASSLKIIDSNIVTAIILLSVITTLFSPIALKVFLAVVRLK